MKTINPQLKQKEATDFWDNLEFITQKSVFSGNNPQVISVREGE